MGENRQAVGRDRHIKAFTIWVAGAALKSDYIHGQSDELGFEYGQLTYTLQGKNFRQTRVSAAFPTKVISEQ